jgi:hypothetical protein
MGRKYYFVSGNEGKNALAILLENLLYLKKQAGENPLFIETDGSPFPAAAVRKKIKNRAFRFVDFLPDAEITSLPLERVKGAGAEGKKKEIRQTEEEYTDIFLCDRIDRATLPLVSLADYLILLLKNNVYCAGFLYTLFKRMSEYGIEKRMVIVYSNFDRLELAARAHLQLKAETEKMLGNEADIQFGGFLPIDVKYLAHAAGKNQPCIKIFPESPFHGVIKYVNRTLNSLDFVMHELPFLYSAATMPKHG